MALTPIDEFHALQIQAGILGRHAGHAFEDAITQQINSLVYPYRPMPIGQAHVFSGNPATLLLSSIAATERLTMICKAVSISTGTLATSEEGLRWLSINGVTVSRCKSDLVITLTTEGGQDITVGVSTKQCNNRNPTNAQLYFTTARGFSNLLQTNGISVSAEATTALRQFCGG